MNSFLDNFLESNRMNPPPRIEQSLKENFADAINIDWIMREGRFEAIFYKDNIEHLALFSIVGQLLEYKMNLSEDFLPLPVKSALPPGCEIMNVVLNNHGNSISYEVIYRDKELRRYVMVMDETGKPLSESVL